MWVMVYYVIVLALFSEASYGEVLRFLLEGLEWLSFIHRHRYHQQSLHSVRWSPISIAS